MLLSFTSKADGSGVICRSTASPASAVPMSLIVDSGWIDEFVVRLLPNIVKSKVHRDRPGRFRCSHLANSVPIFISRSPAAFLRTIIPVTEREFELV
jgi:hypothetical protein